MLVVEDAERLHQPGFSAFEDALARNEFLAVLTIWVVTGVKPTARSARVNPWC
jgi:hypothetical protein